MADPRPYVVNAYVINLLNAAPIKSMRPSLGSLVQRKTIDIGCYPFPFMTNSDNIPLDGRTISGIKFETRPVPFWCSENTYADVYGDTTYNNGKVVWTGKTGYFKSSVAGNDISIPAFGWDAALGVTFPLVRINTAFLGMDKTAPQEWIDVKNTVFGTPTIGENLFGEGSTLTIGNNILFKAWTGLTVDLVAGDPLTGGATYAFKKMNEFNKQGGTFSPLLDRYNYGCLDQIFNSERFSYVAIDPNQFWEGVGASYGVSGGMTGELFLLNALTGGLYPGSYYIESATEFPINQILGGVSGGNTLSGKQLALNLYGVGGESPFLGTRDPVGGFVDTMALLLGTNQKFAILATGGTASLRALDFNNPCSASFVYREDSNLGRWGYEVEKIGMGSDVFAPVTVDIGCNVNTFFDYLSGPTSAAHGIVHPASWMFWKGLHADQVITSYAEGFVHDVVGETVQDGVTLSVYNALEGIHDHLCYEYYKNGLQSRVYYPLRPMSGDYYRDNVAEAYIVSVDGGAQASEFGTTLDNRYYTAFPDAFKGDGSITDEVSLQSLGAGGEITISTEENDNGLTGLNGIVFPYFTPLASFGMRGIGVQGNGKIKISGEFNNFQAWANILDPSDSSLQERYQYFADGVSSDADFAGQTSAPLTIGINGNPPPNMRLYSWNALSKIRPFQHDTSNVVTASFKYKNNGNGADSIGNAVYTPTNDSSDLSLDARLVNINTLDYPPSALPISAELGITWKPNPELDAIGLDCGSYVNVIRVANTRTPEEGGLAAHRTQISNVLMGATDKSLSDFEQPNIGSVENNTASNNFKRTQTVPNTAGDFFSTTNRGVGNFFFVTPTSGEPLAVFESPYYLSALEYFQKYVETGGEFTWWENIDMAALISSLQAGEFNFNTIDDLIVDVSQNLLFPADDSSNWLGAAGFHSSGYDPFTDTTNAEGNEIPGVRVALEVDGIHPAMLYRLMTTDAIEVLGTEIEDNCIRTWRSDGVPCHLIPAVLDRLKTSDGVYNSYFQGSTGCSQFGNLFAVEDFATNKGKDFFGQCMIGTSTFGGQVFARYAYGNAYYSPLDPLLDPNPWASFQNRECGEGTFIADPPTAAALTTFGAQFAEVVALVEGKGVNLEDPLYVRDTIFAFDGSTASINGTSNAVVNKVSVWLQGKLESVMEYYNANRESENTTILDKIEIVMNTLYPTKFPAYKTSFDNSSTYKLWAIKPKCVGEWSQECIDQANLLYFTPAQRMASFAPDGQMFDDNVFNGDVAPENRTIQPPSLQSIIPTTGSNTTILTTDDIVPVNEGFLGAFQTIFIEPLGLATRVLATEAQEVPRATIRSTVFGNLTTVIDSSGFLRDVNLITFESGFGTKILGNSAGNSINISVDGLSLGSMTDTMFSETFADGDILSYDVINSKWVNRSMYDLHDMHSGMDYTFSGATAPLFGFTGSSGSYEATDNSRGNAGLMKFNAEAGNTISEVYMSLFDNRGSDQHNYLMRFNEADNGVMLVKKYGDPTAFYRFDITGSTGPHNIGDPHPLTPDTGLIVTSINRGTTDFIDGDKLAVFLFIESIDSGILKPNFYYQSTPPTAGITAGSRWMDSDTGAEYIYINDGSSTQWIQAF